MIGSNATGRWLALAGACIPSVAYMDAFYMRFQDEGGQQGGVWKTEYILLLNLTQRKG
jgi:hypothetical protein